MPFMVGINSIELGRREIHFERNTAAPDAAAAHTAAWVTAHEALSRLARERAAADAEEGRWLLRAYRAATHVHLGFGSFVEYVERLFGYRPRSTQEKLRVAEALEGLPAVQEALEHGQLSWSAARELTRVAVIGTEGEWLSLAAGKTLRQLEELTAGRRSGDVPSSVPDPSAVRHVLRFEVEADTFALFREALAELRRRSGTSLDDDAALLELARCVLGGAPCGAMSGEVASGGPVPGAPVSGGGGPGDTSDIGPCGAKRRDPGRASYQIALSLCPACGVGHQAANGQLVAVPPEIVEMAHCDADCFAGLPMDTAFTNAVAAARDAATKSDAAVTHGVVAQPPAANRSDRAMALSPRGALPSRAHVGACARQSVSPALRRRVIARDQQRCRIPGCRSALFLDVHHIHLRSEGGRNDAANLITLCGAHHRAQHRGVLRIEGNAGRLSIQHADGSAYGQPAAPAALSLQAKVFSGLRNLGFREGEVRSVMAQLRELEQLTDAAPAQWLREALRRLHPARAR